MSEQRPRPGPDLFVGRLLGIPVYLAPAWFLVAALLTMFYAPQVQDRVDGIGGAAYLVAFGFAVLLYASVLVHELGHSLVARAFRLPVSRITIHAFVGYSEIEREPETPAREALVAVAGPAVSVLLSGVGALVAPLLARDSVPRLLVVALAVSNGMVGALNMLPGLPLDGGRVLRAAVWRLSRNPAAATTAAAWAGRVIGVGIATAGAVWATSRHGGDPAALYDVLVLCLVGSFIWSGATAALRTSQLRTVLPTLRAGALARRALTVPGDLPVAEALRRLAAEEAGGLVVVDAAERPVALVSEAAVAATPPERRPWVPVASLARAVTPELTVDVDLAGSDLLRALQREPASEYLVVDRDGAVFGVLAGADVGSRLQARPRPRTPAPAR